SYVKSEKSKDYIIYGCIGLIDLYTGPHFIVITSIKSLGNIEDKPVYAISKIAILPLEAGEASLVLDKLAQWIDPTSGPVSHIRLESEQSIEAQEPEIEEAKVETPIQPIPVKSPKLRFSFLGLKQDKSSSKSSSPDISLLSSSKSDLSLQTTATNSPKGNKKISFETTHPAPSPTNSDLNSSTSSAASPAPGFFAKLLEKPQKKSNVDRSFSPRASLENRASLDIGNSQNDSIVQDPKQANAVLENKQPSITKSLLKIKTDPSETSKNEGSIEAEVPKSPSALEAAEKFMMHSTKQLADWGEDAVSGLKSSISFSLTKPTSGDASTEGELIHSTGAIQENGVDEEERERNRLLDRRVIREVCSIFETGFYFSTEFNLLTSKQKRFSNEYKLKENDPFWEQVDRRFWWNEHLLQEFINIKAHEYILPVMQGYVEMEECVIEEQPFEFTLISRRGRARSGLRYQRRGIDEDGNTANFVETEQLLRIVRHDSDHQVSFVQLRGSIPLFWSQSPYRLKPIPIMERTEEENEEGFKKHVESLINQYGRQIFVNLVEQHGREQIAGSAYTYYAKKLSDPRINYVEFDFHEKCKGMKYENIDMLTKSIEPQILEQGYCWITIAGDNAARKDGENFERLYNQKGVIRTNCMDCLDRTNVVQSALGRHILNHQLLRLGIASFPDKGLSVYEDFENIFNNVWANNGDAISREYAGTSALKGDFTRTGKRNLQGMINDATNSMARMYQNTFKDNFRQATIDYLLGVSDIHVIKNLQTTVFGTAVVPDPILPLLTLSLEKDATLAVSISSTAQLDASQDSLPSQSGDHNAESQEEALQHEAWLNIREAAIETSARIVISPGEENWKGWTLICCSNEVSRALTSVSSPQSVHEGPVLASGKKSSKSALSFSSKSSSRKSKSKNPSVFYDEKVVLLTEKALYICTYDYEMEKVLEFWRLALEKITGIDKGEYFVTAKNTSQVSLDPLENYGFAIIYRASAGGETMRVNSGSVRNRRMMDASRIQFEGVANLGVVLEEGDEETVAEVEDKEIVEEPYTVEGDAELHDDAKSTKSMLKNEPKDIRSVRFKIVRHPETLMLPYVFSTPDHSTSNQSNVQGGKRTSKDCAEWIISEIVRTRRQLVTLAEKGGFGLQGKLNSSGRHHSRSPSEEYNYHSPIETQYSSVQVDLEIRERILQSLEVSAQLENKPLQDDKKRSKKSKTTFGGFFSSSKSSTEQPAQIDQVVPTSPLSSNKSWRKILQFGSDTDNESDDSETQSQPIAASSTKPVALEVTPIVANENLSVRLDSKASNNSKRDSTSSVLEKLKQAVKNF
ncbi:hypothetical protein BGZ76_002588, partial [Entomortierella beljakovae]